MKMTDDEFTSAIARVGLLIICVCIAMLAIAGTAKVLQMMMF